MEALGAERAAPRDAEGDPQELAILGGLQVSDRATQIKKQVSSPELRKHLRGIEASNRIDRLWMEDERFDEVVSLCDVADSHLISAREAGFRRDRSLLGDHLRRARDGLKLAIQTYNMLPADGGRT
jgi:hypothetical protein